MPRGKHIDLSAFFACSAAVLRRMWRGGNARFDGARGDFTSKTVLWPLAMKREGGETAEPGRRTVASAARAKSAGTVTTILITSVGNQSAIGVVLCLQPVRSRLRVIGANSVADTVGNFLTDKVYLVPETRNADAYQAALERLLESERPAAVLNGRDEELAVLGRLKEQFPRIAFLSPPSPLVPIFNDKYETACFAREQDLPFARTAFSEMEVEQLISQIGFPLIAKPRWGGHASKGIHLITKDRQIEAALATGQLVFQEALTPESLQRSLQGWEPRLGIPWKWSFQDVKHIAELVLGRDGEILSSSECVGPTTGGLSDSLRIVEDQAIRGAASGYARELARLGHRGPLNLQGCLLPDGRFIPYELNARFTGSAIGRAQLGVNQVLVALQHYLGMDGLTEETPVQQRRLGAMRMFLSYDQEWAEQLRAEGRWERRPRDALPSLRELAETPGSDGERAP